MIKHHTLSIREGKNSCPNCIIGHMKWKIKYSQLKKDLFVIIKCNICHCNGHIFDWKEINCKHSDRFVIE